MDNDSLQYAKAFGETQQLGLALSYPEPKKNAIEVFNDLNNYCPNYESMEDSVYVGPQGPILEELTTLNELYNMDLKFSKTFRWSPGYKQQIIDNIRHQLNWEGASQPKYIFERITNNVFGFDRMKDRIQKVHDMLTTARRDGMIWLEDPEVVFESLDIIKSRIEIAVANLSKLQTIPLHINIEILQLERMPDGPEEYVEITDWDNVDYNGFKDHKLSISFHLKDFTIQVENIEGEELAVIPGGELILQTFISIPRLLNKLQLYRLGAVPVGNIHNYYNAAYARGDLLSVRGQYFYEGLSHPYVSTNYGNYGRWKSVCLGDLTSDMQSNAVNLELEALTLQFIQWATTFTVGRTHPLNPINRAHYGLPEAFSSLYRDSVGQNTRECWNRMRDNVRDNLGFTDDAQVIEACVQVCDNSNCALRDTCEQYYQYTTEREAAVPLTDEQKETMARMLEWSASLGRSNE